MTDLPALNTRFAIPGQIEFRSGPGGLAVAEVTTPRATATVALQGAHVMTWAPRNEKPVVWLSRVSKFSTGKSIRGGVPVCWPWFGPHATDTSLPAHGFARTRMWEPVSTRVSTSGDAELVFRLPLDESLRAAWPHPCEVECRVNAGAQLDIALVTRNTGSSPFVLGQALHTYFEVSDVRNTRILGLDGCPYIDKVNGGARARQSGPVRFTAEMDRIYLDSTDDCLIVDPGYVRRIRVSKQGSRSTIVWNPWTEKADKMGDFGPDGHLAMVCVESANAAGDVVMVAPGATHTLSVCYGVERT